MLVKFMSVFKKKMEYFADRIFDFLYIFVSFWDSLVRKSLSTNEHTLKYVDDLDL